MTEPKPKRKRGPNVEKAAVQKLEELKSYAEISIEVMSAFRDADGELVNNPFIDGQITALRALLARMEQSK